MTDSTGRMPYPTDIALHASPNYSSYHYTACACTDVANAGS